MFVANQNYLTTGEGKETNRQRKQSSVAQCMKKMFTENVAVHTTMSGGNIKGQANVKNRER